MSGETAVRNYLTFLRDPASLRDDAAVAKLTAKIGKADDPVTEARLRAELLVAESVDGAEHRSAFVAEAKGWADAEGIPASVLRDMGVPADVLTEAGFEGARRRRRSSSSSTSRRRATGKRVTADDVREVALAASDPFSAKDLRDRSGSSPGTVQKVISEMVSAGELSDLGPDPDWSGRGRPPTRYQS